MLEAGGDVQRFELLLGGRRQASSSAIVVHDKYRGTPAFEVSAASADDTARAVEVAREAMGAPLPAHRRYEILMEAARLLEVRVDEFVTTLIVEGGKPRTASVNEVRRAAETLRWSAEEAKRLTGETIPLDATPNGVGRLALTLREPVGVVAAITPTNSPLNLVAHKVGPALAAGNAVVLKPPQATPVSSLLLQSALVDAGLPPQFLSVVAGPEVGNALLSHPDVDFFNFTGSVRVGAHVRHAAGLRDCLLELGGNSPVVVHSDADVARAAAACASKGFAAAGQACTSVQRIYVHVDLTEEFTRALLGRVEDLGVGDPRRADVDVGPMISVRDAERVDAWIDEAAADGAQVLTPRKRQGALLWPTVLTDVPRSARAYCEEVFGPLVVLETYTELDMALTAANDTPYGLHAAIFTQSLDTAFHAICRLEAGAVLVNEATQWRTEYVPFGGIKKSGSGREGPRYAVEHMTRTKVAMLALESSAGAIDE